MAKPKEQELISARVQCTLRTALKLVLSAVSVLTFIQPSHFLGVNYKYNGLVSMNTKASRVIDWLR
jgi:hypothetical protein